jgi:ABC-2 type transport system ATP-binding protein
MADDQTLIISTHQVHDVEPLLDHLLILSDRCLLLNASVQDLTDRYAFTLQPAGAIAATVAGASSPVNGGTAAVAAEAPLYAEPTLQGNAVITRRREGDPETPLNLELLFNAVTKGLLK